MVRSVPKVLVGLDGSEYSLRAAGYAAKMASETPGAEITAVVVVRPLPESLYRDPACQTATGGGYEVSRVTRMAKDLMSQAGVDAVFESVAGGDPGLTLCRYALTEGFDHIVVGKRGRSSQQNGNLSLGSVAYKVLHMSPCNVTVVC